MRIIRWIIAMTALALVVSGCLGAGGGGGGVSTQPAAVTQLSGQVYFADRQFYGGIAVVAKGATGLPVATTYTEDAGTFAFGNLSAGIYSLTATTGDSETVFATGLQIGADQPVQVPETALLAVKEAYFDRITSSSVRLVFKSNAAAVSQITSGASTLRTTVSASAATSHSIELTGLTPNTYYDFTIFLQDTAGQRVTRTGLGTWTASGSNPYNLAVFINNGAYETRSAAVTVSLRATGATQMRVGQKADLSDAILETYVTGKTLTLSGTDGTKHVYAQFRDGSGNLTPIIHASIQLSTSKDGYLGIWIENGASSVTTPNVLLTMLYPGAENVQIAHDADFTSSYWERYSQYRRWNFSSGDGTKTVYARFSGSGVDSNLIFSASTYLSTTSTTASATASGTTGTGSSTVDPGEPVELVIGKDGVPQTDADNLAGKTFNLMLEGDSIKIVAAVRKTTGTKDIVENNLILKVNGVANGNEILGIIDSTTGIYTSPAEPPSQDALTITAVSNNSYTDENGITQPVEASFYIKLQDFWKPRKTNMQNMAGTDIPIYSLLVDPIWQPDNDYYLFAGTNGYGVWWARVSSTVTEDAATFTWQPTALAGKNLINPSSYIVNQVAINVSNGDIAAATEDGVYIFGNMTRNYSGESYIKVASGSAKGVAWDRKDPDYMYISRDSGIERITNPYGPGTDYDLLYLRAYRDWEKRTDSNASPPLDVYGYSYDVKYLYTAPFRALALSFSDANRLYFGNDNGEIGVFTSVRTAPSPLVSFTGAPIFSAADGVNTFNGNGYFKAPGLTGHPRSTILGNLTDISIDPNSPWTLLAATSRGLYRSTDNAANFTSIANNINTRGTLIDPTNVTYFFYGAENGLYRSKTAGATWSQIKSGLANLLVVNCFTQSEGPPGNKRRIWVGTTGGVYAGAKSLDLY